MTHLLASKEGQLVHSVFPNNTHLHFFSCSPHRFSDLQKPAVVECVVGERHVAVLLEDGRVCRMSYSEELPPQPTSVPAAPTTPSASVSKEKR